MPNTYFQFKQFTIEQEKSSMKVCTDSCLFGAWIAKNIEAKKFNPKNILDIGAGTGLLSLMIAQKYTGRINAVEIDEGSCLQTEENFLSSPWKENLTVFHANIKTWNHHLKYDLIIANPPFFEQDLKASQPGKNVAKHDEGLTLTELLQAIKKHLTVDGRFTVLLPFHRADYFKGLAAENGFYLEEELLVKQTPRHSFFRAIQSFVKHPATAVSNELIIKNNDGSYSEDSYFLLKDYYLEKNFIHLNL